MAGEGFNINKKPAQEISNFQSLTELSDQFDPDKARELQQQFLAEKDTDKNGLIEAEPGVYRLNNALTENNIEQLNNLKEGATVILNNTAGISSELLGKIQSDNIFFSVKGGLDYDNIKKFNTAEYRERTKMSPKGLESAVKYFERVESEINPEWTDLQKCMYAYSVLATDMEYYRSDTLNKNDESGVDRKYNLEVPGSTIIRSLNGVNYGKLTCAGFALVFKEMMDRIGVDCSYQNEPHTHSFNTVNIDGKKYGLDLTWDNTKMEEKGDTECEFIYFGRQDSGEFYNKKGHRIDKKDRLELSVFTPEEIEQNYSVIAQQIAIRKKGPEKPFESLSSAERGEYLPIKAEKLEAYSECWDYARLIKQLTSEGLFDDDNNELAEVLQQRTGFVIDILGNVNFNNMETETGEAEYAQFDVIIARKKTKFKYENSQSELNDLAELNDLVSSLNNKLNEAMSGYVKSLYESADEILENFSSIDETNRVSYTNQYTKLITIRNARNFLIDNGYKEQDVDSICGKIDVALGSNDNSVDAESIRKNEIDFLGAALENDLIDAIQKVNHGEITKEDLINNFGNAEVWASRFMENDLSEYSLSEKEIKEIINEIINKYQ